MTFIVDIVVQFYKRMTPKHTIITSKAYSLTAEHYLDKVIVIGSNPIKLT